MKLNKQMVLNEEREVLLRKWQPFLEGIKDEYIAENTAILLENEAGYLVENPEFASTSTGDIQGLQKIMLPIVRRVFPNLIANNIVSVQPLAAPSGVIFHLKYQYGTDRPGNPAFTSSNPYKGSEGSSKGINGQENNRGNENFPEYSMYEESPGAMEGYNPYYSSDEIGPFEFTSSIAAGGSKTVGSVTFDTKYLDKWAIQGGQILGTIEEYGTGDNATVITEVFNFYYDGSKFVVKNSDSISAPSTRFTVTFDGTSKVTIEAADGILTAGQTFKAKVFYKTDLEFSANIPEMRITIGQVPVFAKTRKLKAQWSQESEQDLKAYHGISTDAELTSLVSNEMISEIDREVIQKAMTIAPASSRFTHNWGDTKYTSGNYLDSHLALIQKVSVASNEIYRKSKIGPANWMVVGTNIASYIENIKGFIPNPITSSMGMSVVKAGTVGSSYDVYKDPMFPKDLILLGHKSENSPFGSGLVYSPYVTNLTPTILDASDFNPRRGFLARYALTTVPHGQYLYSTIKVLGLPS